MVDLGADSASPRSVAHWWTLEACWAGLAWFKPTGLNHWFKPWFKPTEKTNQFMVFSVFWVIIVFLLLKLYK